VNAQLREIGRWLKRQRLLWRIRVARGEEIKWANSALNWREFWQKRIRLDSYPRWVQIGTNWTCNLKCSFCRLTLESTQWQLRQLPKNELEISDRVLEEVLELLPYPEMITLTPLGEPLLYSKLGRILERHRELGCNNLAMTTNANLITDDRAQMLVEGGVSHLFVSVDAVDPALYAQMRVLGSIEKVEAALESINRWKEKLQTPFPTMTLASTFMGRNLPEMPRLLDFALRHRFQTYSIQIMEIENPELEPEFVGYHLPLLKEMLLRTLSAAHGKPIEVRVNLGMRNLLSQYLSETEASLVANHTDGNDDEVFTPSHGESTSPKSDENPLTELSTRGKSLIEKCHYPWYFMLIDTDGDVRPCCWAAKSFGNLNRLTFDQVWNGEAAQEMRQNFLRNHIPKCCQGKSCRVELMHTGTLEQ